MIINNSIDFDYHKKKTEKHDQTEPIWALLVQPSDIRRFSEAGRSQADWLPVHVHRAKVASRPDLFGGVS